MGTEELCTNGHVLEAGRNTCDRCGAKKQVESKPENTDDASADTTPAETSKDDDQCNGAQFTPDNDGTDASTPPEEKKTGDNDSNDGGDNDSETPPPPPTGGTKSEATPDPTQTPEPKSSIGGQLGVLPQPA